LRQVDAPSASRASGQQRKRSRFSDPRFSDPRFSDPRFSDPRFSDPQIVGSRVFGLRKSVVNRTDRLGGGQVFEQHGVETRDRGPPGGAAATKENQVAAVRGARRGGPSAPAEIDVEATVAVCIQKDRPAESSGLIGLRSMNGGCAAGERKGAAIGRVETDSAAIGGDDQIHQTIVGQIDEAQRDDIFPLRVGAGQV
jgi:hypothetical protein